MSRKSVVVTVVYALVMVALIIGVDVAFLRNALLPRFGVNVGIVLAFGAFYLKVLRPRGLV